MSTTAERTTDLRFLGVVANANHSLRFVDFENGFRAEPIERYELISLLAQLSGLPDWEYDYRLEEKFGFPRSRRTIYVLKCEWKNWGFPFLPGDTDNFENWVLGHSHMSHMADWLETQIKLLRIYRAGDLYLPFWAYHIPDPDGPERRQVVVLREDEHSRAGKIFNLPIKERFLAIHFLESNPIGLLQPEVRLALDHFNLSFEVHDEKIAFLTLMTALESLLNVSHSELRFRISRNVAILLGTSQRTSKEYRKRFCA